MNIGIELYLKAMDVEIEDNLGVNHFLVCFLLSILEFN